MSVAFSLQFALKVKQALCSAICSGTSRSKCDSSSRNQSSIPKTIHIIEEVEVPKEVEVIKEIEVTKEVEVTKTIKEIQVIEVITEVPTLLIETIPCSITPTNNLNLYGPQITTTTDSHSSPLNLFYLQDVFFYIIACLILLTVFVLSFQRGLRQNPPHKPQFKYVKSVGGHNKRKSKLLNHVSPVNTYNTKSVQTSPFNKNEAIITPKNSNGVEVHSTISPQIQEAQKKIDDQWKADLKKSYEAKVNEAEMRNIELLQEFDKVQTSYNKRESDISKKSSQLVKDKENLQHQVELANSIADNFKTELEVLAKSKKEVEEKLTNMETNAEISGNKYAKQCKELDDLKNELSNVKATFHNHQSTSKANSDNQLNELRATLASRDQQLVALRCDNDETEVRNKLLTQELSDISAKYEKEIKEKTRKIEQLESDIEMFQDFDKEQVADLEAKKSELETANSHVDKLEKDLAHLQERFNNEEALSGIAWKETETWQLKSDGFEAEVQDLSRDIGELQSQIESRKTERAEMLEDMKEIEEEKSELENAYKESQARNKTLKSILQDSQKVRNKLFEQCEELKGDKEELQQSIKSLKDQLAEMHTAAKVQKIELDAIESEYTSTAEKSQLSVVSPQQPSSPSEHITEPIIIDDSKQDSDAEQQQHIGAEQQQDTEMQLQKDCNTEQGKDSNAKKRKKTPAQQRRARIQGNTARADKEAKAFVQSINSLHNRRLSISAGTSYSELAQNLTFKDVGFAIRREHKVEHLKAQQKVVQMQDTITAAITQLPSEKAESNDTFANLAHFDRLDFTARLLERCETAMPHLSLDPFTSTHSYRDLQKESIESRMSMWLKPPTFRNASENANPPTPNQEGDGNADNNNNGEALIISTGTDASVDVDGEQEHEHEQDGADNENVNTSGNGKKDLRRRRRQNKKNNKNQQTGQDDNESANGSKNA